MTVDTGGRTGRRPGHASSRQAILAAARDQFIAHGYRGATLRAIAAQAGIDPALIRHFFKDKDGLFSAAMELPPEAAGLIAGAFDGPSDQWGEQLTRTYLALWEDPETAAPLRATLVSAFANDQARDRLRAFATNTILTTFGPRLPPDAPGLRLTLAVSHLIGIAQARHLIQAPPILAYDLDTIVAIVGPTIQRYLTGPLPDAVLRAGVSA
ncbi:TetR family transcriptional regulator [Actinocorallia longicatena]